MHPLTQIQLHHTAPVAESHHRLVHRCLTFSSSEEDDPSPDNTPPKQHHVDASSDRCSDGAPSKCTMNVYVTLEAEEKVEEGDFQTVPLNDEHWDMEEITDRHLCIHEHSLPHGLCPYPCPYSDYQASSYYYLSNISRFDDLMATSSDEDISALDGIGY